MMWAAKPVFCRAPLMKGRSSRAVRVSSLKGSLGKQIGTVAQTTMCFTVAGSAAILHNIQPFSTFKQALEACISVLF